jgi:hypothetical protein
MPINNKSVMALIVSAVVLVATAVALYAYEYSLVGRKAGGERKNHSEVRAAHTITTTDTDNK